HHSKEWISGKPGTNQPLGKWNSFDLMGCSGSLRAGANTGNFSVRVETTKVVKNCLKSTLITEIGRIKVPKKGNLLPLPFALFHIPFLSAGVVLNVPSDATSTPRSIRVSLRAKTASA